MDVERDGIALLREGDITEIVGRMSSGRTSLLVACLRDVTRRGGLAALVDADQAFDPRSAERAGVDLSRLLWVRCGGRRDLALRATDVLVRCRGFALVVLDTGEIPARLSTAGAFRLKFAVRRTGAALLMAGGRRIAGSCAALAVETARSAVGWAGPGGRRTRLAFLRTRLTWLRGHAGGAAMREWLA
jgi:hypothetical protein